MVSEQHEYGLMLRKNTTDVMFALRALMKYRGGQMDLQKSDDRVPREEM